MSTAAHCYVVKVMAALAMERPYRSLAAASSRVGRVLMGGGGGISPRLLARVVAGGREWGGGTRSRKGALTEA